MKVANRTPICTPLVPSGSHVTEDQNGNRMPVVAKIAGMLHLGKAEKAVSEDAPSMNGLNGDVHVAPGRVIS